MGRTNNFRTRNPNKLVATQRHAGPHGTYHKEERRRGGARNKLQEYLQLSEEEEDSEAELTRLLEGILRTAEK